MSINNTTTSYTDKTISSMFQSINSGVIPSGVANQAYNSFLNSLKYNHSNFNQQLNNLNASMLSKVTHAFLEKGDHHFKGTITFSGVLTYIGTVHPAVTEELDPFSATSLAKAAVISGSGDISVEIGGTEALTPSFIQVTGAQSSTFNLKLHGTLPSNSSDSPATGTVRRFTIKSISNETFSKASKFTIYTDSTEGTIIQDSTSIVNVDLNIVSASAVNAGSFTLQEITVTTLATGFYSAVSTTTYFNI